MVKSLVTAIVMLLGFAFLLIACQPIAPIDSSLDELKPTCLKYITIDGKEVCTLLEYDGYLYLTPNAPTYEVNKKIH